jgi:hypothetical protein
VCRKPSLGTASNSWRDEDGERFGFVSFTTHEPNLETLGEPYLRAPLAAHPAPHPRGGHNFHVASVVLQTPIGHRRLLQRRSFQRD